MNEFHKTRKLLEVPLKEHLEKMFSKDISYLREGIVEARRLVEKTMEGFPSEYAKKLELAQTATLVKELKDNDLEEIKKLISNKLSVADYDIKHETLLAKYEGLNEKAQGWETIKADINGRLWTLGFVMVGAVALTVAVIEFFFRYGMPGLGK